MEADKKTTTEEAGFFKKYGFYLALAVLAVIVMLPNPEGLSVAGQRMIGIMVFSVIVWAGRQRRSRTRSAPALS